jgi:hypothetical protein
MIHYATQKLIRLGDERKTPRKRTKDGVKKIRTVKPDDQNAMLSDELLAWGIIHQPLWIQTLVAQGETKQ